MNIINIFLRKKMKSMRSLIIPISHSLVFLPEVGSCATSSSVHNEKLLPEPSELPELNREQNADPGVRLNALWMFL